MEISTKYEFTALDSNDLVDKIKTRLEGLGLVTQLYGDNIIGGVTLGKRLHVKVGDNYINFGSGLNRHPAVATGTSNTNWVAAQAQAVACDISKTFNASNPWWNNAGLSNSDAQTINCVYTENNCLVRIFTTPTSIAIVCNYSSIYYNTLYINWKEDLFVTANCYTNGLPKVAYSMGRLFQQDRNTTEIIYNGTFVRSNGYQGIFTGEEYQQFAVPRYVDIYTRLYNLVNKASAILPHNLYFSIDTNQTNKIFLRSLEDMGIVNMKDTPAAYIFNNNGQKYQAFPDYSVDVSSNSSMGIIFRFE